MSNDNIDSITGLVIALLIIGAALFVLINISTEQEEVSARNAMAVIGHDRVNGTYIDVIHDNVYNVTCWHIYGGNPGFSCIPDSALKGERI